MTADSLRSTDRASYLANLAFYSGLGILSLIEAAYFLPSTHYLRYLAALIWLNGSSLIMLSALLLSFRPLLNLAFWKNKEALWFCMAFFGPVILIYIDIGGITLTPIEGEGVVQMSVGAHFRSQNPSLGIYDCGYYHSYPARQYVLNYQLPYFLGQTLVAERLGNSVFYIIGYLIFLYGCLRYFQKINAAYAVSWVSALGSWATLGFYTLQNARRFATDTMPVGGMFMFLGALLLFYVYRNKSSLFLLSWTFGFLPYCYTPALAGWCLALTIMLYLLFINRIAILTYPVLYGLLAMIISCLMQTQQIHVTRKFGLIHFAYFDMGYRLTDGFRTLSTFGYSLLPAPLFLAFLLAFYVALRKKDYRFHALFIWVVGVMLCSFLLQGQNTSFANYITSRNMIIIPPVGLYTCIVLAKYFSSVTPIKEIKWLLTISMLYMFFTGIQIPFFSRTYFATDTETDEEECILKMENYLHNHPSEAISRLYVVPPLNLNLDYAVGYFLPPSVLIIKGAPPANEHLPDTFVISYIKNSPDAHTYDHLQPSLNSRPYLKLDKE